MSTKKFDPARAAILDDEERFGYVPPSRIVELLAIPADGIVLDYGAGTGAYAIEIAERRRDARVIALDEQPSMLERILAKPRAARDNLTAILPDELHALRGTVDRVLALNVLHEVDDADIVWWRELVRPGGRIVVIDWNPAVERPRGPDAKHLATREEAVDRLVRHGFTVDEATGFPYHLAFLATRTAG